MKTQYTMSRRQFLCTTSTAVLGVALSACGPTSSESVSMSAGSVTNEVPNAEPMIIRFHAPQNHIEDSFYKERIDSFRQENGIEVLKDFIEAESYTHYLDIIAAGSASGSLGDVLWSTTSQSGSSRVWKAGLILSINDWVEQRVDLNEWYRGCVEALLVEGQLFGLPFRAHAGEAFVYYNKDLFHHAGVRYPLDEWTTDDQLQIALKLMADWSEESEQQKFAYLPSTSWKGFKTHLRTWGSDLFSPEDCKRFQLDSGDGREATQWLYDLFQERLYDPFQEPRQVSPRTEQRQGSNEVMLHSGLLAMFQGNMGTASLVEMTDSDSDHGWGVVPNAYGPTGQRGSDYEIETYSVTTATKASDAAFDLVRYLSSKKSGVMLGEHYGIAGARPDVYQELISQKLESQKLEYFKVFEKVMDTAYSSYISANWGQENASVIFEKEMNKLWSGKDSPDNVIPRVTEMIQAEMNDESCSFPYRPLDLSTCSNCDEQQGGPGTTRWNFTVPSRYSQDTKLSGDSNRCGISVPKLVITPVGGSAKITIYRQNGDFINLEIDKPYTVCGSYLYCDIESKTSYIVSVPYDITVTSELVKSQ